MQLQNSSLTIIQTLHPVTVEALSGVLRQETMCDSRVMSTHLKRVQYKSVASVVLCQKTPGGAQV